MGEDHEGQPVIYDPSSMFAHNEFELSNTPLLGYLISYFPQSCNW